MLNHDFAYSSTIKETITIVWNLNRIFWSKMIVAILYIFIRVYLSEGFLILEYNESDAVINPITHVYLYRIREYFIRNNFDNILS